MRLIDADGLKIAIRQELDIAEQMAGDEADIYISKMIEEAFFDIIDNTITIEPEQKKGEWLMKWNTFFHRELPACSECGSGAAFKTKFCPCCGAEMENAYKGVSI